MVENKLEIFKNIGILISKCQNKTILIFIKFIKLLQILIY